MFSILRFQAADVRPPRALALSAALVGALLAAEPAAARELCRFEIDGLVVSAEDDTEAGGMGVDISVVDGPLVLTRAAIPAEAGATRGWHLDPGGARPFEAIRGPAEAGATRCWQLDLDGDRRFEVIVGLVEQAGTQPPRLVSFEWNGRLLEPHSLPAMDSALAAGYAGGDALELRADLLIRSFDVRVNDGMPLEKRHFRYAPDLERWIPLQALKRDVGQDANRREH